MSMPPPVRATGLSESLKVTGRTVLLDPTRPATRLLRGALAAIALLVSLRMTIEMFLIPIWGVDVVIPLRAASRWLAGGEPYLASSWLSGPGYDNPYLYPPIFLPLYGLATLVPLVPLLVFASVAWALAAYAAPRRLGLLPIVVAAFLWPPVSGTIQGGNIEMLMFAAFASVYWFWPRRPYEASPRVPGEDRRPAIADGLLAGTIAAAKKSQAHA